MLTCIGRKSFQLGDAKRYYKQKSKYLGIVKTSELSPAFHFRPFPLLPYIGTMTSSLFSVMRGNSVETQIYRLLLQLLYFQITIDI